MTQWVRNLISSSWINVSIIHAKASTLHNNKTTLNNQTCSHVSNNPCKSMKIKHHLTNWKKIFKQSKRLSFKNLPCIGYSLVIHNNKYKFSDKCRHRALQTMVHCLYVLAIYLKGQMLESKIKIKYPLHVDVFMVTFKQGLECPKGICSEVETMFQIHVIYITLVDLDNNHKVAHKHISHLCKFNQSMHRFQ